MQVGVMFVAFRSSFPAAVKLQCSATPTWKTTFHYQLLLLSSALLHTGLGMEGGQQPTGSHYSDIAFRFATVVLEMGADNRFINLLDGIAEGITTLCALEVRAG